MNEKNMKRIILKAVKHEEKRLRKENMTENEKLRQALVALAVIVVAVGVLFLAVITTTLIHMDDAAKNAPATRYNLNCLVEVKGRPLEECRE